MTDSLLEQMLQPISDAISPDVARKLVALRANDAAQARIDELAAACNEGTMTPQQDAEYRALVTTASVIAVLQSKARAVLAKNPAA